MAESPKHAASRYISANTASPIEAVEFARGPEGDMAFIFARSPKYADALKSRLAELGQTVVNESRMDGKPILITQGAPAKELLEKLNADQAKLSVEKPRKAFNAWWFRGAMGLVGQLILLTSKIVKAKQGKEKFDLGTVLFSVSNLTANLTAMVFGSSKETDQHRLLQMKNDLNTRIEAFAPEAELPGVNENHARLRGVPPEPSTLGKAHGWLQRNAAKFNVSLRLFGASNLILSGTKYKSAKGLLSSESRTQDFSEKPLVTKPLRLGGASTVMMGKLIALGARSPDPYNPKPNTPVDDFREELFKQGAWTEALGYGTLAFDAFKKKDITSGIPYSMFVTAYLTRILAKMSVKDVDMKELVAHTSDALAQVPTQNLNEAVAASASAIAGQMKDKHVRFGDIYARLTNDLAKQNHIALNGSPAQDTPSRSFSTGMQPKGRPSPQTADGYTAAEDRRTKDGAYAGLSA
jgi:hypothetical protein